MSLPNIYFYSFKIASFYESTLISLYLVEPHNFRKYGTVSLKNVVWNHYTLCMIFYSKWASVKSAEDHSGHKSESVWKSMHIYWTETSSFIGLLFTPLLFRNFIKVLNAKRISFALEKKQYLKAIAIYILSLKRK